MSMSDDVTVSFEGDDFLMCTREGSLRIEPDHYFTLHAYYGDTGFRPSTEQITQLRDFLTGLINKAQPPRKPECAVCGIEHLVHCILPGVPE